MVFHNSSDIGPRLDHPTKALLTSVCGEILVNQSAVEGEWDIHIDAGADGFLEPDGILNPGAKAGIVIEEFGVDARSVLALVAGKAVHARSSSDKSKEAGGELHLECSYESWRARGE
jgi:hypothetical protein